MSTVNSVLTRDTDDDKGKRQRPVWEEKPTTIGLAAKGVILGIALLAILFPVWIVAVTSVSDAETISKTGGLVVWPDGVTLDAYRELLRGGQVARAMWVSIGVTVVGTAFSMAVSVLAAYGLSRMGSLWHRPLLMTLLLTMFFGGAGIIPTYLLIQTLGLMNTYAALILPMAVNVFNILVLRSFFMNVGQELIDSARIDGAGELRILLTIVLPLSRAVLAVISLFYAVAYWGNWFAGFLYITDQEKLPLQNVLQQIVLQQQRPTGMAQAIGTGQIPSIAVQTAVMIMALLPVAILSPFVQRHFKKGMLIGAVKG
ncbi:carbohydrate ABC transporter permease [Streptomyces sp. 7-21]|jgi:putative aldouronate transport system permease protein|uniref:carbohydrate ABC transporter permease n=1 Tax=Streptomyces sp. 7-21 TaxID=2802283 RepID=UPI00191D1FA9|nr:carbohydrate ABC transporter permease [Streptomyces sp. 7-21]MBL1068332.1 carbohydrate ABC transporter permease [Streptomyces sp. 7-21]